MVKASDRRAFGKARPKFYAPELEQFKNHQKLFLIGGGSRVSALCEFLRQHPALGYEGLRVGRVNLEPPADLERLNEGQRAGVPIGPDEFAFLSVAYGLSHLAGEIPEAYSPDDLGEPEGCVRYTQRLSHEDIYAK